MMAVGCGEGGMAGMGKEWMLEMIQFMHKLDDDLTKSGELVSNEGLADGSQAKTVRFQNGIPVSTDGPFAAPKESLVGYWIVDVEREERAIEIASRIVAFVKAPIDVRRGTDAPPEICRRTPRSWTSCAA